jgi:hypothetical protein
MFKFSSNMAIVMMAFFISCGQVEESSGSNQVGSFINLLETEPVKAEEQSTINNICYLLKEKKRQMKSMVANFPLHKFEFKAKKENCSARGFDFTYSVSVENTRNGFVFKPQGNTTFNGFREIIFDDYDGLEDFCTLADTNNLSQREIIKGNNLVSILALRGKNSSEFTLTYASKVSENTYEVKSTESYLVADEIKGLFGLVVKRMTSDRLGCTTGSHIKYAELIDVKL